MSRLIVVVATLVLATLVLGAPAEANEADLPTRYAVHLGDIERVGTFYGALQLGLLNQVGLLTYRQAGDGEIGQPGPPDWGTSPVERFEGRFVGLAQIGLFNQVYRSAAVGVRLGLVNVTGTWLGPSARHRGLVDAGIVNLTFGHHAGLLQLGVVNHSAGFLGLGQLGGWNSVEGLRIACLAQIGSVNLALKGAGARVGLQAGGFNAVDSTGRRRAVVGLQLGAVNLGANALVPLQLGVINIGLEDLVGSQVALVNHGRGSFTGVSLGVVNVHREVRGLQVGLFNYAGRLKGVQLGLVNVAGQGGLPAAPLLNIGF